MRRLLLLLAPLALACGSSSGAPTASDAATTDAAGLGTDVLVLAPTYAAGCSPGVYCAFGQHCDATSKVCVVLPATAAVPDFTLPDRSKTSPTAGQVVTLSKQVGHPVVLYFALAT
jgi:hypothetical protein